MVDNRKQWKAWLYLSPALILLLVFTVWPIINTVMLAFREGYDSMLAMRPNPPSFPIGIQNFKDVLGYGGFVQYLGNTMLLCVATVPISTILALLIAVALNSIKPLRKTLQTIFFLPYVTNSIAIGMVFAAMFNVINARTVASTDGVNMVVTGIVNAFNSVVGLLGFDPLVVGADVSGDNLGIVNTVISFFGGKPINWINQGSNYWHNMFVLIVYIVWNALPFKILVLLGGLQSINKQYYEAARVDGTPRWRVLTRITTPLLSPMIVYVVITGFIGGFKEYSSVVGIFGDKFMGPPTAPDSLNTMVGYIYKALEDQQAGTASAAALILFAIILVVTLLNLQISKKRVHY